MTWLELIDELRKQPLYLLEQEVAVWCDVFAKDEQIDYFEKPVIQLTSPYNDGAGIHEWLRNPDYHLSAVIRIDE